MYSIYNIRDDVFEIIYIIRDDVFKIILFDNIRDDVFEIIFDGAYYLLWFNFIIWDAYQLSSIIRDA